MNRVSACLGYYQGPLGPRWFHHGRWLGWNAGQGHLLWDVAVWVRLPGACHTKVTVKLDGHRRHPQRQETA